MAKMTEKEKMLAGRLYDPADEELVRDRKRAKRLCWRFNRLDPDKKEEKQRLLNELFRDEVECHIEPGFYCDYGYNIEAGDNFYANHNCVILDVNSVVIGENVMFGPQVQVYTATHPIRAEERQKSRELGLPVEIGAEAWIGGNVVINPGISVGKKAVIGAGSVLTEDIPAGVVAAGNPCRVIREI